MPLTQEVLPQEVPNLIGLAQSYAAIAGWLAGIAAAGLVVYLTRHPEEDDAPHGSKGDIVKNDAPNRSTGKSIGKPIGPRHVVSTLFFSMAALAICAFLYASMTDDNMAAGRQSTALMFYGAVLGTSVLSLFYSVALMIFEHQGTRKAARSAYWVIVILGPAVVIRFIAGATYEGWRTHHQYDKAWVSPMSAGLIIAAILAVIFYRSVAGGISDRWPIGKIRDYFRDRPSAPAFGACMFAAAIAYSSGILSAQSNDFIPPEVLAWIALGVGVITLTVFALACASVLGVRVDDGGRHTLADWEPSRPAT
jgi:hypothetical protein